MAPKEMFMYAGANAVSAITEALETIVCQILDGGESVLCDDQIFSLPEPALGIGDWEFWVYLGVYVFLVLFAGLCSGLTLGLLSLDVMQLTVLIEAGTPEERANAKKILPLVKRHHLLLVTLLLANACAVEAMPIFLDRITDPVTAILISVTAVLLFGEVFPQALCSRYGLKIGATLVPIVWTLICLFFVIAWPLSKLLDCLLGKEENKYLGRGELKALVGLHGPSSGQLKKLGDAESPLTLDEVLIIKGALEMRDKCVGDAMISIKDVFMLDKNAKLDRKTMRLLLKESHSRVPVYDGDRKNIVGVLLVKMLITLDPDLAIPISKLVQDSVCFRTVDYVAESMPLFDLLNQFQTGRSHLSIVRKSIDAHSADSLFNESYKEEVIGIITLEDVIEELLQEEILDEKDTYTETEKKIMIARDNLQSYSRAHSLIGNIKLNRYNPISRSKSQPAFEISNSCKVNRKKSRTKPKKYEPKETISDFDSDPDDPKIPLLKTTY